MGNGWLGSSLGDFELSGTDVDHPEVHRGIFQETPDGELEFLCTVANPPGGSDPQIYISQPFLWFWSAYQVGEEWRYLTCGGQERELIRYRSNDNDWTIEARIDELRTYLHTLDKKLLIQLDYFRTPEQSSNVRQGFNYDDQWGKFELFRNPAFDIDHCFERLQGFFYIEPKKGRTRPRILGFRKEDKEAFGSFIIGYSDDGEEVSYSSYPDGLSNPFGANPDAPDYLTPVFFRREVLNKYSDAPTRYSVTTSLLKCLDLWGLAISINEHKLVVAYLGDIGRDLPVEEHKHWMAYNVPPESTIDEGRFRRDFLGHWVDSPDLVRELQEKVFQINKKSNETLGISIWKPITPDLEQQIGALIGPNSSDPAALVNPILILTKWLVDSLNNKGMLTVCSPKTTDQAHSLETLKLLLEENHWPHDVAKTLKALQGLRSRGGIAHLKNSGSQKSFEALGLQGLDARQDFDSILKQLNLVFGTLQQAMGCSN